LSSQKQASRVSSLSRDEKTSRRNQKLPCSDDGEEFRDILDRQIRIL